PAPEEEARDVDSVRALELALELTSDEKSGQDEEEVHPGPAVPEEREAPDRGGRELRAADREVISDQQDDGRGAERVERGERSGRGNEQRPERAPRPPFPHASSVDALAHARGRRWVARSRSATPRIPEAGHRRVPDGAAARDPDLRRGR